jgi:hypothetical protein
LEKEKHIAEAEGEEKEEKEGNAALITNMN